MYDMSVLSSLNFMAGILIMSKLIKTFKGVIGETGESPKNEIGLKFNHIKKRI